MFDIIIYLLYRNLPAQNHPHQKFQKVDDFIFSGLTFIFMFFCIALATSSPVIDLTLVDDSELKKGLITIVIMTMILFKFDSD